MSNKNHLKVEIRRGRYYDSVLLMQLQRALAGLPGVQEAGVVMGTAANKAMLSQGGLLAPEAEQAGNDDLLIVLRADSPTEAEAALAEVDSLLTRRRSEGGESYRPQSLETAVQLMPEANWVLVSVPGRYAAGVAKEALQYGKHVFLYSDNVSVEEEVDLKAQAAERGLLVMGPDCGTAIVNGVGLGFANRVRRGKVGLVAASGTGLQAVTTRLHQLGGGVSHALGTGGRDLSVGVGAATTRQALTLLADDPATEVIVLLSKPPAPEVAEEILALARTLGKPVVVDFIGYRPPVEAAPPLYFARTFDEAARLALSLLGQAVPRLDPLPFAAGQRYLRGLFSGGTLAYEAQLLLAPYLPRLLSNVPLDKESRLPDPLHSEGHCLVDLGADDFTVGRLHPMMDHELRLQRLRQEAANPEVALILLDVVLGDGAHPDPASELAPAIAQAKQDAERAGRFLEVVALVVGSDEDPQGLDGQMQALRAAGAWVGESSERAMRYIGQRLQSLEPDEPPARPTVDRGAISQPLAALNVGVESFAESLAEQGAGVLHLDWRPPAGGNERLMGILARMKGTK